MSTIKGTCCKGAGSVHRNGSAEGRPVRAAPCAQQHQHASRRHGCLAAGPAPWATQRLPAAHSKGTGCPAHSEGKAQPAGTETSGLSQTTRAVAAGVCLTGGSSAFRLWPGTHFSMTATQYQDRVRLRPALVPTVTRSPFRLAAGRSPDPRVRREERSYFLTQESPYFSSSRTAVGAP